MTQEEVIKYIAGKNNNIEIVKDSEFDDDGIACKFNGLKFCYCYRNNQEVVFYKNIVFNHTITTAYTGNYTSSYLTTDKIDQMYEKFMTTYSQASLDLKEIIMDENLEEIKKDFR